MANAARLRQDVVLAYDTGMVNVFAKGRVLSCKRPCLVLQKGAFYVVKGALSQAKRPPFAKLAVSGMLALGGRRLSMELSLVLNQYDF